MQLKDRLRGEAGHEERPRRVIIGDDDAMRRRVALWQPPGAARADTAALDAALPSRVELVCEHLLGRLGVHERRRQRVEDVGVAAVTAAARVGEVDDEARRAPRGPERGVEALEALGRGGAGPAGGDRMPVGRGIRLWRKGDASETSFLVTEGPAITEILRPRLSSHIIY